MSKRKLGKLINDNIVLIVGIPLIIGIHYGWAKLQDIPYLVDPAHKKQLPIITIYESLKNKVIEKLYLGDSNTSESKEK
ncbi:uncharacterized protein LOC108910714 isoform X1 [Anoplophora glabripennis]|uniref:uncharacterized protein LOC108910714 isoform X1 n=1 Tax=Anoplophora glabripennis TaxID=217634 RepID=UPI0008742CB7|nr:uncharacterized protein LOC108910714 isoform X1 [Anoplophora glabripennis]